MTEVYKGKIQGLEYDPEGFRMATPPEIADYKSRRLAFSSIADLGCGIGIQSIYFSSHSEKVIAVEKDEGRFNIALNNFYKINIRNIEMIKGDALDKDIAKRVGEVDVVHSDPSRLKSAENWSFEMLSPNPLEIVQKYKAETFTFDLPVHLKSDRIPESWEREYISLKGEPKRIITYTGKAKQYNVSAITLPSQRRLIGRPDIDRSLIISNNVDNYIHDLDQTIHIAGLLPEFLIDNKSARPILIDSQRIFLTSEEKLEDDFILNTYEVKGHAKELNRLKEIMRNENCGKVIMRFSIPDNLYYAMKKILEKEVAGNNTGYIFKIGETYYLGKKIIR